MPEKRDTGVIRLLDDETVNTIAAGEVIERPASVVKELVENAVDAGADMIKVDITVGTQHISSVQVSDTGCGMQASDARMSFVRHATSKIHSPDDLSRIHTMGFRGEALASIAAVSRITLTTRAEDNDAGTEIIIEGGEILSVSEVSAPQGTTILVDNIFFNTPARRKFLKSKETELLHIYRAVEAEAFAHPESAFRLRVNGKEKLRTQRTTTMLQTIAQVFGTEISRHIIPLSAGTPVMRVDGAIVRPEACRPNAGEIHLCVNGRPVTSPQIVRAIRKGYGTLIPKGRFPVAYLSIKIDTSLVDVNVHPAKREIHLSREKEIISGISDVIRDTLQTTDLIHGNTPAASTGSREIQPGRKKEIISDISDAIRGTLQTTDLTHGDTPVPSTGNQKIQLGRKKEIISDISDAIRDTLQTTDLTHGDTPVPSTGSRAPAYHHLPEYRQGVVSEAIPDIIGNSSRNTQPEKLHIRYAATDKQLRLTSNMDGDTGVNLLPSMRIIGQVADGYILAASRDNDELLIIDQHAAHERILYDQLCRRRDSGIQRQELLVPLVVELNAAEKLALSANVDILLDLGFIVDEFGPDAFVVRAVPMVLGKRLGTEMIHDIVSDLVIESRKTADEKSDRITATIACRGAIKAGSPLTQEQMERLVLQLSHTSEPYTCPHGRPVILSYSHKELDRMFHRT
ncbi:DNA mismatch repair endonuclease MutL [Methanogenium sp. MK-MG]|uniref:DNA mismatch repair endonuclease MutL n=1 Tax=Methanogenium sp. MK-MG TaxID=2599926 RepID=UPI0013EA39B2|nr:DNA mismatch repair endonuclease MutL [Methanogenium sp. MK-MG]KAF1078616.1 DNA mismatch repair protein MutL [Methanogenium sp. MK-MG]